jgi:hypothetical protein
VKKTTEDDLRSYGYMTIEDFIDCLMPSLTDYMNSNWGSAKNDLHHPEDLFSTASIYIEVGRTMAGSFIVAPKKG